jgi:cytochrome oxidase Cu insertion factor (SCO1/SenC/PrrC family)
MKNQLTFVSLIVFAVLVLGAAVPGKAIEVGGPSLERVAGRQLPDIPLIKDSGHSTSFSQIVPLTTVVQPVFTRCLTVCGMGVRQFRDEWLNLPSEKRPTVVVFSFDPDDTVTDLNNFRLHHQLPQEWHIVHSTPEATATFLDQMDFRYKTLGKGAFDHPSVAAIIDSERKIQGFLNPLLPNSLKRPLVPTFLDRWLLPNLAWVVGTAMVGILVIGVFLVFFLFRLVRMQPSTVPLKHK